MTATTETARTPEPEPESAATADSVEQTARTLHSPVVDWFTTNARDLPWRRPEAGAWGVMVSEFMLQQTPVNRVLPVYEQWLSRWPRPADLAAEPPGEAVRAWGRLGYPRRALRLHGAAAAIAERHGGDVPREHAQLLALPGVGEYTAAAVASFAYGQRHAVLDTNVRRVFARSVGGRQYPPNATTAAERKLARALLAGGRDDSGALGRGDDGTRRAGVHGAHTGLRALPDRAAVRLAACGGTGARGSDPPRPDVRRYGPAGTRQAARGAPRCGDSRSRRPHLTVYGASSVQRARALDGLVADGLVEPLPGGAYRLPLS